MGLIHSSFHKEILRGSSQNRKSERISDQQRKIVCTSGSIAKRENVSEMAVFGSWKSRQNLDAVAVCSYWGQTNFPCVGCSQCSLWGCFNVLEALGMRGINLFIWGNSSQENCGSLNVVSGRTSSLKKCQIIKQFVQITLKNFPAVNFGSERTAGKNPLHFRVIRMSVFSSLSKEFTSGKTQHAPHRCFWLSSILSSDKEEFC